MKNNKAKIQNEQITELSIVSQAGETIFGLGDKYMIPLYQRAFAWTDDEINQLLDDINDNASGHYYLGSLIVNKREQGLFEVIDGQQRLTALFVLLSNLKLLKAEDKGALTFECRDKSNYTLKNLSQICDGSNADALDADLIDQSLVDCWHCIAERFAAKDDGIDKGSFVENLKRVKIFRIEVPPCTDLNRYFEIMNVRGEQLEQHDILKGRLMASLKNESEREIFATIWDACRDMTGYVQRHFQEKYFKKLFKGENLELQADQLWSGLGAEPKAAAAPSINKIIKSRTEETGEAGEDIAGGHVRFASIIDFSHFLLHVLRVFALLNLDKDDTLTQGMLDDKKLLSSFDNVLYQGKINGHAIDKAWFAKNFVECLLSCRLLFDKFIIKRDLKNLGESVEWQSGQEENGEWSLKQLKKYEKKYEPVDTDFGKKHECGKTRQDLQRRILMLEACLRVSYTSPRVMHWITRVLLWLKTGNNLEKVWELENVLKAIAREPVSAFLAAGNFKAGVDTPHIVLNYLDYLLWENRGAYFVEGKDAEAAADFKFEFRKTVEHWYPQHPSKDTFERWEDCDRFGNLCILARGVNSRFSNLQPTSKKNFKQIIEKGSLKLRLMAKFTRGDANWRDVVCEQHEEAMLGLLKEDCKLQKTQN